MSETAPTVLPPDIAATLAAELVPRPAGRPAGRRNNNPKIEEALRRKTWKRATRLLDQIVKGELIPHHGKVWEPTEYQRMQAAARLQESYDRWVIANKATLVDVSAGPAAIVNIQIINQAAP